MKTITTDTQNAVAIIPARYGSTRFPGKMLMATTGKPLVQHVVDQVQKCDRIDGILVATDDQRIIDALKPFGTKAIMTGEHPNGTSRLAEVASRLGEFGLAEYAHEDALIINVQGDEPEIEPALIDQLVIRMVEENGRQAPAPMGSLACPILSPGQPLDSDNEVALDNHNVVKVVLDQSGYALYFSRSRIPFCRDGKAAAPVYQHVGLYAYRLGFLSKYVNLSQTPLENEEKLEQLRVLEHGFKIAMTIGDRAHPGIDTQVQYDAFVTRFRASNFS